MLLMLTLMSVRNALLSIFSVLVLSNKFITEYSHVLITSDSMQLALAGMIYLLLAGIDVIARHGSSRAKQVVTRIAL